MTALFSTAEQYTAFSGLGATVMYTPGLMTMSSGMSSLGGATVESPGQMTLLAPLSGLGGALIDFDAAAWTTVSDMTVSGGGAATMDPLSWSLGLEPYSVSAGGMVGTFTDVNILEIPSTAQFSTAELAIITSIVRTLHKMNIGAQMIASSGATVEVGAEMVLEPNQHGPVARPRAVQSQFIMS